jgi:hypothetical protein
LATGDGAHHEGHQKAGKASFEHIYDSEDPREYFNTLGGLGYEAPRHGYEIFSALIEEMRPAGEGLTILDVCCSYGINGALLKYDIGLDDLYARYGSEEAARKTSAELAADDREFYAKHRRPSAPRVIGLDVAENAVAYGVDANMLDAGVAENLEDHEPSGELQRLVSEVDLITVTGGVGYIGGKTFERLLKSLPEGKKPWIAVLALRWVDFGPLAELFAHHGYVTEPLGGRTFEQRRFADTDEQEYVCEELSRMGVDPAGKESEGSYHAYFYLSRPADEAAGSRVEDLVGPGRV